MGLQWVSCSAQTGRIIADLPTLVPEWPLRRTLCKYETATADLYLDGAPINWEAAVLEGAAVLASYDDDDPAQLIQWAGIVTEQDRDTTDDKVTLSLVTAEGYFDRRFVGDVSYAATGQNAIVENLVELYATDGATPGLPITVRYVTAGDGVARDRTYYDTDNSTLYTRLTQLAGVINGCEWTIEWEWVASSTGQLLAPVLLVGDRIGSSPPAGQSPAVSFEMPGNVISAQQTRSYADGNGANIVMGYSSGQGTEYSTDAGVGIPSSGSIAAADFEGRPAYEYRWQPSTSITDPATLTEYAQQAVAMLAPGMRALTLTAELTDITRHGNQWSIGDDVGYQIGGLDENGNDTVLCFPGGISGSDRAIAYELSEDPQGAATISPIIAQAVIPTDPDTGD